MALTDELRSLLVRLQVLAADQIPSGRSRSVLDDLLVWQAQPAWFDPQEPALTAYQRTMIERRLRAATGWRDLDRDLRVNQYLLLDHLGDGGMATVWKAWSLDEERVVAIKRIRAHGVTGDQAQLLDRQEREVQILSRLRHPHIVEFYREDVSDSDGARLLVMEFVAGTTLEKHVAVYGVPDLPTACDWLITLLDALAYAHEQRVLHRDLSWKNVMVTAPGKSLDVPIKLLDFGLSKMLDSSVNISQSQQVLGTPQFMSPEHFDGAANIDERSDLYSLGCLAYALLTGQLPFAGSSYPAYLKQHMFNTPVPPRQLRPELPLEINQMVMRLLSKVPDERGTATQALRTLLQYQRSLPTSIPFKALTETPAVADGKPHDVTVAASPHQDSVWNGLAEEPESFVSVAGTPTETSPPRSVALADNRMPTAPDGVAVVDARAATPAARLTAGPTKERSSGPAVASTAEDAVTELPVESEPTDERLRRTTANATTAAATAKTPHGVALIDQVLLPAAETLEHTWSARAATLSALSRQQLSHPLRSWMGVLRLWQPMPLAQRTRFIDPVPTGLDIWIFWIEHRRWQMLCFGGAVITVLAWTLSARL
jgi:serine/threonine protein kinase